MRLKGLLAIVALISILGGACATRAGSSQQAASVQPSSSPASAPDCHPTQPATTFIPPSPYPKEPAAVYHSVWLGTAALWTMLRPGDRADGRNQKLFWWSANFDATREPEPAISVTGRRLDGSGSFRIGNPGTNASADFGTAMLV
ncbi:MAG: hypothetical protein QOD50_2033, partial [Actinomycetota bacterium]|nr:hypothetical protein [Actinomycetota bacterium]